MQQEPQQISYYPKWPESALSGKRSSARCSRAFRHSPHPIVDAASEEDREWRAWLDGGFEAHKFIHKSISRQSYADVLNCLHVVLCQQSYPDLWAVLKFVPKKNGLNPALSLLAKEGTDAVSVASLTPRVLRRRLDDLQRTFEQSWVLISCYLSQPPSVREDLLWAARTVTEKVKTDQRSRALELLCLGFFGRGAALFPLIVSTHAMDRCDFFEGCDPLPAPALCYEAYDDEACVYAYHDEAEAKAAWLNRLQSVREMGSVRLFGGPAVVDPDATRDAAPMAISLDESDNGIRWLRESFTCQYSGDDPHAMLSLGKRGWERSRLSFPYLEIAQRTWRKQPADAGLLLPTARRLYCILDWRPPLPALQGRTKRQSPQLVSLLAPRSDVQGDEHRSQLPQVGARAISITRTWRGGTDGVGAYKARPSSRPPRKSAILGEAGRTSRWNGAPSRRA